MAHAASWIRQSMFFTKSCYQIYVTDLVSCRICWCVFQEDGRNVVLLLYSLRLDPVVQSALQPYLSSAADMLLDVWMKCEDVSSWREAERELAEQLVCIGPSHRAIIRLLQGVLCRSQATICLSRTASILLISQVLGVSTMLKLTTDREDL
jgi:hypothetical protein